MQVNEIIAGLYTCDADTWRDVYRAAIANQEAVTPHLIGLIRQAEMAPQDALAGPIMGISYLHAMYLLAQFREVQAYPAIVALCSLPGTTIEKLTGDFVTEDLHQVLASVYGGDLAPIQGLIEGKRINPWVRNSALHSLGVMAVSGLEPRQGIIAYLRSLFEGRLADECEITWGGLVSVSCDLAAQELLPHAEMALSEDKVDPLLTSLEKVRELMGRGWPKAEAELRSDQFHAPIADAIETASWMDTEGKDKTPAEMEVAFEEFIRALAEPPTKPKTSTKIGRNQPCPCGSGKKYKHCCGRVGR